MATLAEFPENNLEKTIRPGFFLLKKEMVASHKGRAMWVKALDKNEGEVLIGPLSREDEELHDPSDYRHKLVSIREITGLRLL
jgi:hypothetical protein